MGSPTARERLALRLEALAEGDPFLSAIRESAVASGARLLLVGGFVRDAALGLPPKDADFIVTGAARRELLGVLSKTWDRRIVTFRKRGIVNHRISLGGRDHDLVELSRGTIERELRRRDFTINAVAFDLASGRLIDPRGGIADLRARRIAVGDDSVFRDDPLRMIRAVRLACELAGFSISKRTLRLIRRDSRLIRRISAERVREELERILSTPHASSGLSLLDRLGLLSRLLPEIEPLRGLKQNRYHHLDGWRHTLAAVAAADVPRRLARGTGIGSRRSSDRLPPFGNDLQILRWALLFHDLGKAETRTRGKDGEFHFFGHEKRSAVIASRIAKRLRFTNRRARAVRRLVELHLRIAIPSEGDLSDKACRRLIRDAGELTPLLVLHSLADKEASRGAGWRLARARLARTGRRLMTIYREAKGEILAPPRLIDGHDVMRTLGIGPGAEVGRVLADVRDRQVAGELSTREQALAHVRAQRLPGASAD